MNVASTAAFQPTPFMATYGATKAFVLHWSLALKRGAARHGVRALAVCPGRRDPVFSRALVLSSAVWLMRSRMTAEEVVMQSLSSAGRRSEQVVTGWKN